MSTRYKTILLGFAALQLHVSVAAAAENNLTTYLTSLLQSSLVASLSMGPSWESAGQTQTLNLAPGVIKTYAANKSTNVLPSAEFFLGIKNSLPKQLEGQIGLALITTADAMLSGNVWDDGNAAFNNYNYQYNVTRTAIALKGKLLGQWGWPVIPWISATLGVGFNEAHHFTNTPTIYEAVAMPNFANNTVTAFTYAIGIGTQYQIKPNWQIGAGYEFSDWGRSQLGSTGNSGDGPSLSHLYTNSVLFNLTYVA